MNRFSRKIKKFATGWLIFVVFLLDLFFVGYLLPPVVRSIIGTSANAKLLDMMILYSPETAYDMMGGYGAMARSIHLNGELALNIAYSVVTAFFFSLLITSLMGVAFPNNDQLLKLNLLPFSTLIFVLLEDAGIATMLLIYPDKPGIIAWLTTIFGTTKWLMIGVTLILVFSCILATVGRRLRRRRKRSKHHHSHELRADKNGRIKF